MAEPPNDNMNDRSLDETGDSTEGNAIQSDEEEPGLEDLE